MRIQILILGFKELGETPTLPAEPFFCLLNFDVLEKDSAWIEQDLC